MDIMTNACFSNHLHNCANDIRKQRSDGEIGLRASGTLAKLAMFRWMQNFKVRLKQLGIKEWIVKK